ncbi:hypothetical protein [Corynebacterium guangdongense]|uniref:Lipoprotein n=1 Tax=Corynebacterium guangdongense TaxID=1783348 RepID=A0ABU1ZYS3_9CORY|nr:hypothetical protein [Corynebacterium guangdongense]MDR7330084.1 hypothetical protein [Corynebacterium guangdongense]WJZ18642.1 hypothetical protein CGUA_10440 [Corynebacterium guangdongense]
MRSRRAAAVLASGAAVLLGACGGGAQTPTTPTLTEAESSTLTVTVSVTGPASPGTAPATDPCQPAAFVADFTEPVVLFCAGGWARAGQAQTDHVLLYRLEGERWRQHPHDGRSSATGYVCYDESILRAEGAPRELIDQVLLCRPENG